MTVAVTVMLVDIRVFAHQHGDVGVVHHVVTDAAHECAPESSHSTTAEHNKRRVHFLGNFHNNLPWLPANALDMAAELEREISSIWFDCVVCSSSTTRLKMGTPN